MSETTIPTSEVLYRAADLIEERGWTTGVEGMQVGGPHCLLGAIGAASAQEPLDRGYSYCAVYATPAARAVMAYLDIDRFVEWWNDDQPSREPVIEVLRAAAVIEAAKENAETRESVTA